MVDFPNNLSVSELDYSDIDSLVEPEREVSVRQLQSIEPHPTINSERLGFDPFAGIIQVDDEQRAKWESMGKIGFVEQWRRIDKSEMIPFWGFLEKNAKASMLLHSTRVIKDPEADPRAREFALNQINNYLLKIEEERTRGVEFWGEWLPMVSELPSFMVEFLAFGGIASLTKAGASKAVTSVLSRAVGREVVEKATKEVAERAVGRFATKSVGAVVGGFGRTVAMSPRVGESYSRRQMLSQISLSDKGLKLLDEAQEKPLTSFMKAFGDIWIENVSEVSSPAIASIRRGMARKIIPSAMRYNFSRIFRKLHPEKRVAELFTQAGWSTFVDEMGEEVLGDALRAMTGVESFGAENPDSMWDRLISSVPNSHEALLMASVLAVPGTVQTGLSMTAKLIDAVQNNRSANGSVEPEDRILSDEEVDRLSRRIRRALKPLEGEGGFVRIGDEGEVEGSPEEISQEIGRQVKHALDINLISQEEAESIRQQADDLFERFNRGEIETEELRKGLLNGLSNISYINSGEADLPKEDAMKPEDEGPMHIREVEAAQPIHIKKASQNARKLSTRIKMGPGVSRESLIEHGFEPEQIKRLGVGVVKKGGLGLDVWASTLFGEGLFESEDSGALAAALKAGDYTLAEKQRLSEIGVEEQIIAYEKEQERLAKIEDMEERERLAARMMEAQKEGFTQGIEFAMQRHPEVDIRMLERRIARVEAAQHQFGITDLQLRQINDRDFRLMSDFEFEQFLLSIESKATQMQDIVELKAQVIAQIKEKRLKNWQSLLELMELPPIEDMTADQLKLVDDTLDKYRTNDIFLPRRNMLVVDMTPLKGVRTIREAREKMAQEMGVSPGKLPSLKMGSLERFMWDSILAEKHPFFRTMVLDWLREILIAEQEKLNFESELNRLMKKARRSRERALVQILIPIDENLYRYIQGDELVINNMTPEEIDVANFLLSHFSNALEYLMANEFIDQGRKNYLTHVRQRFLESIVEGTLKRKLKEDGVISVLREVLKQSVEEESFFEIRETETGRILTPTKFFRFAMRRRGKIDPTKNVARAANVYFSAFYKKKALDKIIGKLDTYVSALAPERDLIESGDVAARYETELRSFFNDWMNTKKGLTTTLLFKQFSAPDMAYRGLRSVRALMHLGANLALGVSQPFGEQVATYANLGRNQFFTGWARLIGNRDKAARVIENHRAFIGKPYFAELTEAHKDVGDQLWMIMFGLYHPAAALANRVQLLGSMTREEWEAERVSPERLAEIKLNAAKFRKIVGMESVYGATTVGRSWTTYKTWLIPVIGRNLLNIRRTANQIQSDIVEMKKTHPKESEQAIWTRVIKRIPDDVKRETLSQVEVTIFFAVLAGLASELIDDDDKTIIAQMIRKVLREVLTISQALDPIKFLATPVDLVFLQEFVKGAWQILRWEKYKDEKRGLKGIQTLKRALTPRFVGQFLDSYENKEEKYSPFTGEKVRIDRERQLRKNLERHQRLRERLNR